MEISNKDCNIAFPEFAGHRLTPDDLAALAGVIGNFLALMKQKPVPASEREAATCRAAFGRLERLQQRLAAVKQDGGGVLFLRLEDLLALDAALLLFSVFLVLEMPASARRELILEALWAVREHLAAFRRLSPAGLN